MRELVVSEVSDVLDVIAITMASAQVETEIWDAGDLGLPFMQAEHEEEWMSWINWGAVEGASSSSAAS